VTPGGIGLDSLAGARVAVWGTGTEGRSMIALARGRAAEVTVVDDRPIGSVTVGGEEIAVRPPGALAGIALDIVVRSPGVSRYRDELAEIQSRGAAVTTTMAMWLNDAADRRIVGVTGSKGKSTTVTLASVALRVGGLLVATGGNIGTPVTDFYGADPADVYVVEVSSFQAAEVTTSPTVGILTLVAPDHLDWHGTEARYVDDKLNLFRHGLDTQVAVNGADPATVTASAQLPGRTFYGGEGRVTTDGRTVHVDGAPYLGAEALRLRGHHNLVNLCGALTGVLLLGEELPHPAALTDALGDLEPLPSRLHTIATWDGIDFVDDTLASNPAGTVAALRSFPGRRICLLAGGRDRGVAYHALARELGALVPAPVVVVVGSPMRAFQAAVVDLAPDVEVRSAATVADAVSFATDAVGSSHTTAGGGGSGVVLFSPGAPTPPEEGTYRDRSRSFAAAVAAVASRRAPTT
jgi:UDP-N-acetylmuramoyl-L-alanine---L-glutamate ligase